MKLPGPDHPITVTYTGGRVRILFAGKVIADSTRALTLNESGYEPVHYLPRADVDMSRLRPTDHTSHCPYKGDASYFSIAVDGHNSVNAVSNHFRRWPRSPDIWRFTRMPSNRRRRNICAVVFGVRSVQPRAFEEFRAVG